MRLVHPNKRYSNINVSPVDLATQFTLIDLPIFKSIRLDELISLGTNKDHLCPNVVAMKKQFNQVSFWIVGQILSHESVRYRAELISFFIKTAKQLYLLNNLHSSNAVISALLSSPIYRLEKTWHIVRKKYSKDLLQFEQLKKLYSDNNNYELLRNHLSTCSLPCIPYLGMYSRDIIYINEAHQEGTIQRTKSTSRILEALLNFQTSDYENLVHLPDVHQCFVSSHYIDELQKFVEDENYRRSLELEAPEHSRSQHNPTSFFKKGLYLIDDSSIDHTILPPISTSS